MSDEEINNSEKSLFGVVIELIVLTCELVMLLFGSLFAILASLGMLYICIKQLAQCGLAYDASICERYGIKTQKVLPAQLSAHSSLLKSITRGRAFSQYQSFKNKVKDHDVTKGVLYVPKMDFASLRP